jgi:antitoxin FitA
MPTLYVRNMPEDLYRKIRTSAASKRRSMAAEVVVLLEEALEQEAIKERRLEALTRIAERRRNYHAPENASDSLTLLREDRDR